MNITAVRAFLALYDELSDAYQRLKRDDFSTLVGRRCFEFRAEYPDTGEALAALMMHFHNRRT